VINQLLLYTHYEPFDDIDSNVIFCIVAAKAARSTDMLSWRIAFLINM